MMNMSMMGAPMGMMGGKGGCGKSMMGAPMGMMGGKGGKGMMGMMGMMGGEPMAKKPKVAISTGSPAKDAMVEKIKAFQRSDPANKEAWGAFCAEHGNVRDPARHEEHVLQIFIAG